MVRNDRQPYVMYGGGWSRLRRSWIALCWALLVTGVLLQAGPHLKVKGNQYVVPPSLISGRTQIRPAELIARERRMQLLSAVLTLGGAVGLSMCYSKVFLGARLPRRDFVSGATWLRNNSR
jgi:hypothetical protein